MTSFCHQLRLLLWKNFILRKRNKVRIVVEVLWPLILFLILMWVRTRGLRTREESCHLVEKALPSVGGFPFLQNFICTLNNTCFTTHVEDGGTDLWKNASFLKLVREGSPILKKLVGDEEGLRNLNDFVLGLNNLVRAFLRDNVFNELKSFGNITLKQLLNQPNGPNNFLIATKGYEPENKAVQELLETKIILSEFGKASYDKVEDEVIGVYKCLDCNTKFRYNRNEKPCTAKEDYKLISISDSVFDKLCHDWGPKRFDIHQAFVANLDQSGVIFQKMAAVYEYDTLRDSSFALTNYLSTLSNIRGLLKVFQDFQASVSVNDSIRNQSRDSGHQNGVFAEALPAFFKALCGTVVSDSKILGGEGGTNAFDTLRDRLSSSQSRQPFELDPDVSTVCNTIFQEFEKRPLTRVFWRQVKPFIRGRILYYPRTVFTETLMKSVDEKFSELKELEAGLNMILGSIHRIRVWLNNHKSGLKLLQKYLTDIPALSHLTGINEFLLRMANAEEALLQFRSFNFTETEKLLERMDFGTELDSQILSCIRYNKSASYWTGGNKAGDFASEDEAVSHGMDLMLQNNLWALVVFLELPENGSAPNHLKYKIRMDSDKVDGTRIIRDRLTRKRPRRRPSFDMKYFTNGFIYLQEMIEQSFVNLTTENGSEELTVDGFLNVDSIIMQQFPYPCYIFDLFIKAISRTFPLFMVLSWVYAASMLIKSVVLEKELRLKEVMRVMGCGNIVVWTAWFIDSFIMMSISCLFLSIILKFGEVIQHSDFGIIFMFLIVYSIATICFSFLVSTFFTKANSAAAAGGILFFVSYLPYNFMLIWEERLEWHQTLISCLFSNVAFGFGCTYIARLEEDGLGAQWNRLSTKTLPGDDFNFVYCVAMLVFDSFLYFSLALYIEAVFPGENGSPRKWYFFVQRSFWCAERKFREEISDIGYKTYTDPTNSPVVEDDPDDLRVGVSIQHLCKKYPNGRIALADLNLSFFENQITSFLGHNGAGKTTTMSILTGLIKPSEGTALIYGMDIKENMDIIRRDLGFCPQFNVLFNGLNVEEHLKFYAGLKGKGHVLKVEMDPMLFDLGIPHKKKEFPENLSGGMKRKLSVAIAFVGGSNCVFLDEPTSGVDPYSRRSIWELLLKYKRGRTIILSTHFMDEADVLGDRIAIISRGQLKACGTSLFLKNYFGQGYFLRLVRQMEQKPIEEMLTNNVPPSKNADSLSRVTKSSEAISAFSKSTAASAKQIRLFTDFLKYRIPEVKLVTDVGLDAVFLLPTSRIHQFENLFKDLDENLLNLGILSYGISDTTLEEVFLQITVEDLQEAVTNSDRSPRTCHDYCCTRRCCSSMWNLRKNRKRSYNNIDAVVHNEGLRPNPIISKEAVSETRIVPSRSSSSVRTLPSPSNEGESVEAFKELTPTPVDVRPPSLSYQGIFGDEVLLDHGGGSDTETENEDDSPPPMPTSNLFGVSRTDIRSSWWIQSWVIILKRFRNSNRNKRAIFFEVIVPALFIALMLLSTLILPPVQNEKPREVTFTAYESPNYIFYSLPGKSFKSFQKTVEELTGPIGLGTPCLLNALDRGKCDSDWSFKTVDGKDSSMKLGNATLGNCSCTTGSQVCEKRMENPPPPRMKAPTNDFILDVSHYNVSAWVSRTYFKYFPERYGGFQMILRDNEDFTVTDFLSMMDKLTNAGTKGGSPYIHKQFLLPKPFYKIWFENRGFLSSIAYLNGMNNMILRRNLQSNISVTEKRSYGITLITHPMNLTKDQLKKESLKTAALGVVHAICVIFALSFVPASFTVYLIDERKSGAKHLHLICGVRPLTYWISNFIFDMLKFLFSALLCVSLFWIFDAKAYIAKESVASFVVLLILYGWAAIPLMYPSSFAFGIPSTAFVVLACFNLFIGVITTISTFVLDQFGDEELTEISGILQQLFLIFPHYCLGRGLMELVQLHIAATALERLDFDPNEKAKDRFQWNILGKLLTSLVIQGVVFFIFTILIEYKQWAYLLCCKFKAKKKKEVVLNALRDNNDDDEDVVNEEYRVTHNPPPLASLLANNLSKVYFRMKKPAVNNLSFAVESGECFGLLGVNGAGKSSTFKMLTGDVRITSGKAYVMGYDVEKNLDAARKHFGYCPQEDGIDPLLNSFEQLELYGRLRGLTLVEVRKTAAQLISSLGLMRYATKRCGTYSGGNKRKVSTAIALIGNPHVVFLDEPTSGMDPGARRQLWKLIIEVTRMGKSVILTSHSMEECEALCNRLAIMVNGKFMCLGSLQHLKNRFGTGYRLTVRCPVHNHEEFLHCLESSLDCAALDDVHCSQLKFNIPQDKVRLSEIFSVMCSIKSDELIEDFSVSQTTLDDIFIKFASQQREDDTDAAHGTVGSHI